VGIDMDDKVVLITGASGGIGREIAQRFAVARCRLALTFFEHRAEAEEVAELCRGLGSPEVLTASLQLADEDSLRTLFEAVVDRFGGVDILVNSAGIIVWVS
jgi:3-oxoacyl-[acyl-carrier protein] reductase